MSFHWFPLEKFCTDVFLGGFVLDSDHFWRPPCANSSLVSFSDDNHNRRFARPYCSAQFTCDAAVITNQRAALVVGRSLGGLSAVSFSPLVKRRSQPLSKHPCHHTRCWDSTHLSDWSPPHSAQYVTPRHRPFYTATVLIARDWLEHRWCWWSWLAIKTRNCTRLSI